MKAFINNYIAMTNDDLTVFSVGYYDLNLEAYIDYNPANTVSSCTATTSAKTCRCSGNSN